MAGDKNSREPMTVAAAAVARGRPAVARSIRFHRPRGPFCGTGWCQQCPISTGDGHALACRTVDGRPTSVDPLRPLGRLAERWPPAFYETRFLRPRWLRQSYLRVLRRLSAAGSLARDRPAAEPADGPARTSCDALVVGGGLAGLAAAVELAARRREVLVVEAGRAGGAAARSPRLRGRLQRLLEAARNAGVRVWEEAVCVGLYAEEGIAGVVATSGPVEVRATEVVIATGAYDRPLLHRGNDLPGIVGLRGFEALAAQRGVARGATVGVFAGPAEARRALAAAEDLGLRPAWVAGPAADQGITHPGTRLLRAVGRRRVRAVDLTEDGGAVERLRCDLLVVGFSQPTWELQVQAGMPLRVVGDPPVVVADGTAPLVVGEAVGWVDLERAADAAAAAARAWATGEPTTRPPAAPPLGPVAEPHADAFVCFCEDVRVRDVERAATEGFEDPELLKRRTGALTGPCQGKLCLPLFASLLPSPDAALPTVRPPVRPISIGSLAGFSHG